MRILLLLVSAALVTGCSKNVDIDQLNGDWVCTEFKEGKKTMVSPMRFQDGQFDWTIPSKSPSISTLVRARYTLDDTTLRMPELYLDMVGMPYDDDPGWSLSNRSIVTGIEQLTEKKLILAPWTMTSSERELRKSELRFECVRLADEPDTVASAQPTDTPVPTRPAPEPSVVIPVETVAESGVGPTRSAQAHQALPAVEPITVVVKLALTANPQEVSLVGVTILPRTAKGRDLVDRHLGKIRKTSVAVLGPAMEKGQAFVIGNVQLADQLLAELRRQLADDFIESVSLDDVDAGAD